MPVVLLPTVNGNKYFEASGAGTAEDPYRIVHEIGDTVTVAGDVGVTGVVDINSIGGGSNVIGAVLDAGALVDSDIVATTSADATGGVDITAVPTSGQRRAITDLFINVTGACTVTIRDNSGTPVVYFVLTFDGPTNGFEKITTRGKWRLPVDKKLRLLTDSAVPLHVTTFSHSELA